MSNEAKPKIFICPNCGATFERNVKRNTNIMKCRKCKPRAGLGKTDNNPCRKRRKG